MPRIAPSPNPADATSQHDENPGRKERSGAHLGQLSDHPVALLPDQLLDGGVVQDDVGVLADLDATAGMRQDFQPARPRQLLGHNYALCASFIVHLCAKRSRWQQQLGRAVLRSQRTSTGTPFTVDVLARDLENKVVD
jgi:hypothetical protein